jgi:hypothetical protein
MLYMLRCVSFTIAAYAIFNNHQHIKLNIKHTSIKRRKIYI